MLLAYFSPTASQLGQDYWVINQVFNRKREGFFVEIGAHDGIELSNTYLLEKRYKWTGLCIEANPETFNILASNRDAVCLNICLDSEEKEVQFRAGGMMGGIVDTGLDNEKSNRFRNDLLTLNTRTLESVLDDQEAPAIIDYLSIDVEGAEERILAAFDFERYTFIAITIERPSEFIQKLLKQNGYILVKHIPNLDYFYIHQSHSITYMDNMIVSFRKRRLLLNR